MTDTPVSRPRRPIYLADLFLHFKIFSERVFSGETMLRHIEQAHSLTSEGVPERKEQQPEVLPTIAETHRAELRHIHEKQHLRQGLALYLFDQFLHPKDGNDNGRLNSVCVKTQAGTYQSVGQSVFAMVGDFDCRRINLRRSIRHARQQLLEIAGQYEASYPLVDTTLWTVINPRIGEGSRASILDGDDCANLTTAWAEVMSFAGHPLWFRGAKPTKREMNSLLGKTTWLDDEHIAMLAEELHRDFRMLPGGKLFQDDAARFIGIEKNTRSFSKIWKAFLERLTPEERANLPRRGEKKRDRRSAPS